jgi:D-ribose pyranose/furanose isomerase RbsD
MKENVLFVLILVCFAVFTFCSCSSRKSKLSEKIIEQPNWREVLKEKLPLIGHRNWIVITDMAYPLQAGDGIITLYANEPYLDVLKAVKEDIDSVPHVFAHVYRDKELTLIPESDVKGISDLRRKMDAISGSGVVYMPHEHLIAKLAEAQKMFTVIIIKTNLTIPYTTTFFQLDCKYWDAERQQRLDKAMEK